MRTLILGGGTFVGRRALDLLVAEGHDVTVLNRGRTSAELPPGVARIVGDRTSTESMQAALAGTEWDAVIDVSGFVMAAGGGQFEELLALLDGQVGSYVFVSSIMSYAPSGIMPWPEDLGWRDDPESTYGGFKAHAERSILQRHASTGFPGSIARPAAIYGPDNNIYDMEAAMFRRLLERRPILLPHEGLVVCSYGHVDDLCRALLTMATHPDAVGEVFNVTTSAVTSAAYISALSDVVGVQADVVAVDSQLAADARGPLFSRLFTPAHHGMLDATKIIRDLGVIPEYDLRTGHVNTFEWFLRSGAAAVDQALADPLWGRTFDFAAEAQAADAARLLPCSPPTPPNGRLMDTALAELLDKQEIAELCAKYAYALDQKDWSALRGCFTDAPVFVHPGGRIEGIDGIVNRTRGALEPLDASQHLLGNIVVDVDGDTARSICYFQAQHLRTGTPGGDTYIIAGSYSDTLTRTPQGWRITERVQAYSWRDGNRAVVAR